MGAPDDSEAPLDVVTSRLISEEHEATVDAICEAVFQDHPAYEGMRDKTLFRTAVFRMTQLFCSTVAAGRPMTPDERSGLYLIGSQRARQGLREYEMVEGFGTGMHAMWGLLTRGLAELCESQELQELTTRLFRVMDVFRNDAVAAFTAGFRGEKEQPLPPGLRAQAEVIDYLVDSQSTDERLFEFARDQAVPVLPPLALVVVSGSKDAEANVLRQAADEIVKGVPDVVAGSTRMAGVAHVILLVNKVEDTLLRRLRETTAAVARRLHVVGVIAGTVERPRQVAHAYRDLVKEVPFASLARPDGGLVSMDELGAYRLFDEMTLDSRVDYAVRVLHGVIYPRQRDDLLDTFDAWFLAGEDTRAAGKLLGVSAQTVRYRLNRLQERTGKSLAEPGDRLALELAHRFYRAWPARLADNQP